MINSASTNWFPHQPLTEYSNLLHSLNFCDFPITIPSFNLSPFFPSLLVLLFLYDLYVAEVFLLNQVLLLSFLYTLVPTSFYASHVEIMDSSSVHSDVSEYISPNNFCSSDYSTVPITIIKSPSLKSEKHHPSQQPQRA